MSATHIVDFGFGKIEAKKTGHHFIVTKSDDDFMPVGTKFPVKDTVKLEATVEEIERL